MKKIRITTILGTRPELIRLSVLLKRFDIQFEHRLVHTGQNSDPNLSTIFFKQLGLRRPDLILEISKLSLGQFLGNLFSEIEKEFEKYPPDAVVILGDTNSALAGIIAKRRGIPVYHLEAGNRSFDQNVPEEINRKIVDHFADFNLAYTSHAKDNLLREGLHPRTLAVIGSPLFEVIESNTKEIDQSKILNTLNLSAKEYFLVSFHRQENVDNTNRLSSLTETLNLITSTFDLPIIVTTHPRTKSKINSTELKFDERIRFYDPFGFFDYCHLQKNARIVLSDSGSLSEESAILGFKAILIRNSTERTEALEAGAIILGGIKSELIVQLIIIMEQSELILKPPHEYLIQDTSTRVINFISSTLGNFHFWSGIRRDDIFD